MWLAELVGVRDFNEAELFRELFRDELRRLESQAPIQIIRRGKTIPPPSSK